jgi:hypothetical protein
MPRRGELVGEAYVRIHADTTMMRRAIKRAANEDADDYTRSFSERIEAIADQEVKRGRDALARAIAIQDFSHFERQFGSVRGAVRGVTKEVDELVDKNLIYAKDVDVVRNALSKWAVPAQLREDMDKAHIAAVKQQQALDRVEDSARRVNAQYDAQVRLGERLAEANEHLELQRLTSNFKTLRAAMQGDNRERDRAIGLLRRHGHEVDDVAKALVRNHSAAGRLLTRMQNLNAKFDEFGDVSGRVFGKGSRNNFLNFVGSFIGGVTTIALKTGTLIGPLSNVGGLIGNMIDQFKVIRASGGGLGEALFGALAGGLKAGVAGLIAFAAAAAVLATLLPLLASLFALLAGSIVAVVGAITVGLIGGFLALVPIGVSVAAALGLIVVAIKEMKRDGSGAQKAIQNIGKEWKSMVKGLAPEITKMTKAIDKTISPLLKTFVGPLLQEMAKAMTDIIIHLGSVLNSPVMKGFLDIWETALPASFESIGKGLNNLIGGFVAFFTPILGNAADLSMSFEKLTDRFLKWAQSPEGQTQIADWMDTAWEAANSLWNILGNVIDIIGSLFTTGTEGPGQDFLTYLEDITEKFQKFLDSPEGKEKVKNFFKDVGDFMKDAKGILEGLAKTFDELDTQEGRDALKSIGDAIVTLADGTATLTGWLTKINFFLDAIKSPAGAVAILLAALSSAFDAGSGTAQAFNSALLKLNDVWISLQLGFAHFNLFLVNGLLTLANVFFDWAQSFIDSAVIAFGWVPGIGDKLKTAQAAIRTFKDGANESLSKVKTDLEIQVATLEAKQRVNDLKQLINSVKSKSVVVTATTRYVNEGKLPNGGRGTGGGSTFAAGTIANGPTPGIFGEAGREALVPLDRPLSLVDPSVRALSAFAQGLGGNNTPTIAPGAIVVHTAVADPTLVASSVLDRIAAGAR